MTAAKLLHSEQYEQKDSYKQEEKTMFQIDPTQKFMALFKTPDNRIMFEDVVGWAEDPETKNIYPLTLDYNGLTDPTTTRNFIGIHPEKKAQAMIRAADHKYSKVEFVKRIKEQYPNEVKQKLNQLSGLVSEVGAAHIVANEKGIEVI